MRSSLPLALLALLLLVRPVTSQFPNLSVGPNNVDLPPQAADQAEEAVATASGEMVGDVDKMVYFTLRFGFAPGDDRLPEEGEVKELLCATQEFLLQHIGDYIEEEGLSPLGDIKAVPTNVAYKHEPEGLNPIDNGPPLTVEITFTIHATYMAPGSTTVPKLVIVKALELTDAEVLEYIYYAWDHTDGDSLIQDLIRVHYTAVDAYPDEDRTIMLSEIPTCTDDQTIWRLPDTKGDDGTPPPTMGETVDPQDVDDLVYFKFGVNYPEEDEGADAVPTEEEIHQLMCALNRFIQLKLAESIGDDSVAAQATNIQWISSATNDEAGVTLYFTSDASDGQGEPIPIETVSAALEDVDEDELLQFLKTEGVEHFLEEDDINPMLELPTDVDLEPLPEGTPVREGNMEVSECPSVPVAPAANRGSGFDLLPGGAGDDDGDGANDDGNGDGDGNAPTATPTEPQEDGSGGDGNDNNGEATPMTIKVDFLVSNMEGITDPNEVKGQGVASTWPTLVNEVVDGLKPTSPQLRGRRKLSQILGLVEYRTNSATITSIHPAVCGDNAPSELKCHTVHAKYDLLLPKEMDTSTRYLQQQDSGDVSVAPRSEGDPEVRRQYEVNTYKAIYDGTYYDIILEDKPDSPIFIGTLPKRAVQEPEDHYDWLWLVILLACLLALLLCCMLCWCLYYYCYREEEEREEESPRPITQHTHVWVKNEDTTHWDDEASQTSRGGLNFEDPYARALVPVEEEGHLVPYKNHHTADPLRRQGSHKSLVSID